MYNQKQCPDTRYLQDEIDRLRADEERRRDEEYRERQERNREREQRFYEQYRTASTWPESLRKQAGLFRAEANQYPTDDPEFRDELFGPGAEACERALVIWKEVEPSKREQIEALEAQIEALKEGIKLEVADRLESEAEGKPLGWKSVAGAIRDEDPSDWLNW